MNPATKATETARPAREERSHHVVFGPDVDQQDAWRTAAVIDGVVRRHQLEHFVGHIDGVGVLLGIVEGHRRRKQPTGHGSFLTQPTGKRPGVDSSHAGYGF